MAQFDYDASHKNAQNYLSAAILQELYPGSPSPNIAQLQTSPVVPSILAQLTEAPDPALSAQGFKDEAAKRNHPLDALVTEAENSYVPPKEGGMIDSLIRAIAGGVAVGFSPNSSAALQQHLGQQQGKLDQNRALEQAQKDKVLSAKKTAVIGKMGEEKELREELREDRKLIFAQKEAERKQKSEQEFRVALQDSENRAKTSEILLNARMQAQLEALRQRVPEMSRVSLNDISLMGIGVDPTISSSYAYKMGYGIPPTPEEAAEIRRAQEQKRRDAIARAAMSRTPVPQLFGPKDIEAKRMAVYALEKNTLTPAVYGDEGYEVVPNDPKKQKGMPVMKSDTDPFAGQVMRKKTDQEASEKADAYAQDLTTRLYGLGQLTPEVRAGIERYYAPHDTSLESLGPLRPEGERVVKLLQTMKPEEVRAAIDKVDRYSPDMKDKLKRLVDTLSKRKE